MITNESESNVSTEISPKKKFGSLRTVVGKLTLLATLGLFPASIASLKAGTFYWDGSSSTSLSTAANFSTSSSSEVTPAAAPSTSDDIVFNISAGNNTNQIISMAAANRTYNGLTFNNAGTSQINSSSSGSSTGYNFTLGAGGISISSGGGAVTFGNTATDASAQKVNMRASASLAIDNDSSSLLTFNRTWTSSAASAVTLSLTGSGSGGVKFSDAISDGGTSVVSLAVNTAASAVTQLSAANTYTGGTTLTAGKIDLGDNAALGAGTVTLNGGQLAARTSARTVTNAFTLGGNVTLGGSSSAADLTLTGAVNLNGGTRTVALSDNATLSGVVSNGGLSVSSSSGKTLNLDGANTYASGTTLNSGNLGIGNNSALGTGAVTVNGGAIGTMSGSAAKTVTNNLVAGGDFTFGVSGGSGTTFNGALDLGNATRTITLAKGTTVGGTISNGGLLLDSSTTNTLTLNGSSTYTGGTTLRGSSTLALGANNVLADSGAVTVDGGTLALGANSDSVGAVTVNSGGITGTGTLTAASYTMSNTSDVVVGAVLSGSGSFTKSGAGVLTLSNANTFTGPVTLSSGRLALEVAGALNSNAPVAVNFDSGSTGILDVRANTTVSGLSSSSAGAEVRNSRSGTTRTLTVENSSDQTFNGQLKNGGGTLALAKSGSGILTLGTSNSFSGGVTLKAGGIYLGSSQALGSGALTVEGGRLAAVTSSRTATNAVNLNGDLTLGVGATGGQSLTLSGNVNLGGTNRTLNLDNSATLSGQISNGGLTVASSLNRRLTLSGSNSYGGATTLNSGTLEIASSGNIASSATTVNGGVLDVQGTAGVVTVNNGGTIKGDGTVSALTIASGGTLAPGNSPGTLDVAGNVTWGDGGHYQWEINDWTGTQGTNWDFLNITGTLTISAATSPFIIDVVSLLAGNSAGDVPNFAENSIYTFAIATAAGGISGFESSLFTINTSGFSGLGNTDAGTWAIARDNTTINLVYTGASYTPPSGATAIPEPGTASLLLIGLAGVLAARRSRRG